MNFTPISKEESAKLQAALEANAHRDAPILMNVKDTSFVDTATMLPVPIPPPPGLLERIGNWFTPKRINHSEPLPDVAEVDDMVNQVKSIPSHY